MASERASRRHHGIGRGDNETVLAWVGWPSTVVAMFQSGSTDRWHWSEDAFPPLAFCVHALVRDGLKVPPFDRHPGGDQGLRERGLDAETWRMWVSEVVGARGQLSVSVREHDWLAERAALATLAEAAWAPAALCPGTPELRARLEELWMDYQPEGERWKWRMTGGSGGTGNRLTPQEGRRLWNGLLPFHDRLPTISVFLVDYSGTVVMAVPPSTCLISPGSTSAEYAHQVLSAAEQLAAAG